MTKSANITPITSGAHTDSVPQIRVILADSQAIFRVGMSKILAAEPDIRVVAQVETLGETLAAVAKPGADVLLFEGGICPTPVEALAEVAKRDSLMKIIVMTPHATEEETIGYLRQGVRGIISRAISPELLVRCIRKVNEGETWLDNEKVNWIIQAYRSQAAQLRSSESQARLNEKELLIISGVTQGLRNKDIAREIGTTEQVVKNYLRKIYDKLGISDRLELALYCVHNRVLESNSTVTESEPRATAAASPGIQG
ncbi:MAG TPA: response regulator transcription factor [Terriglobales bacterium]|nr:response regulator transcription factor [Terriglobales bacterium]